MTASENGLNFIKREEGCILHAYKDSVGIPTIGFGNTFYLNGTPVKMGDKITQIQADELIHKLVPKFSIPLDKLVQSGVVLTQNQYDALLSLSWNIGTGGFETSTLYKKVQSNPNDFRLTDVSQIPVEWLKNQILIIEKRKFINTIEYSFLIWNKAGGKNNIDLYRRRQREYNLYKTK
jgi:lysozyme